MANRSSLAMVRAACIIFILFATLVSCEYLGLTPKKYTLTITQPIGGIIAVSPVKSQYLDGDQITLTATPSTGYIFATWGGSASGSASPLLMTIASDTTISATFSAVATGYTVTVTQPASGGTIALSPQKASYANGDVVIVTATPATGYSFTGWSGDLTGTTSPASFTVSGNATIGATWTQQTYTVTATQSTGGTIVVSPATGPYHYSDAVTISATPSTGYSFAGWTSGLTGTSGSQSITVTGNLNLAASWTVASASGNLSATGTVLGDYTFLFTISGVQSIAQPVTTGSYPVFAIASAAFPITIQAATTPAGSSWRWYLDGVLQASAAISQFAIGQNVLSKNLQHFITCEAKQGSDPYRSATIIIAAGN